MLREKKRHGAVAAASSTQMARLPEHAGERHAHPDGRLPRYATGAPLTSRRYDHLWTLIRSHLPGPPPAASAPTGSGTPP